MTTNGTTLSRKLPALLDAGLDTVNISLDTLLPEKFEFITRRPGKIVHRVLDAIHKSVESSLSQVKVLPSSLFTQRSNLNYYLYVFSTQCLHSNAFHSSLQ